MTKADDQNARRGGRRRVPRALLYGLLALWLVGVVAVVLLVLALARGWQLDRLRPLLEFAAEELLERDLQIERLEGSLLEGLTLHEVSLASASPDGEDHDRLVVGQISLRVKVWASLAARDLLIEELSLSGMRVAAQRDLESGWQVTGWGALGAPTETGSSGAPPRLPFDLKLERLTLRDIEFELIRDERSGLANVRAGLDADFEGIRWAADHELAWPRKGEVKLHVGQISWRDFEFEEGTLECGLQGNRAQLRALSARGPMGQVSGGGDLAFSSPPLRAGLASGRITLHFEGVDWGGTGRSAVAGDLSATLANINRSSGGLALRIHAGLEPSQIETVAILGGDLRGEFRPADLAWEIESSFVELDAGRIDFSGRGRAGRAHQLDVSAENLELSRLPAAWGPFELASGKVSLGLELTGPLSDPAGRLRVGATQLRLDRLGPGELRAEIVADGGRRYRLERLELSLPHGTDRRQRTWLRSRGPAAVRILPGGAEVSDLDIEWTGGTLRLDGGFQDGALLRTRLTIDALDLSTVSRLAGLTEPVQGEVTGRLNLAGPPVDPDVEGQLSWQMPRLRGLRADRFEVAIATRDGERRIVARLIENRREQLHLAARLPRSADVRNARSLISDGRSRLQLRVSDFELAWLSPLLERRGYLLTGSIDGTLTGVGNKPLPRVEGLLHLWALGVAAAGESDTDSRLLAGPVSGGLRFEGDSVALEALRIGQDQSEMALDGRLARGGPNSEEVSLRLALEGIGFTGQARASVDLRGHDIVTGSIEMAGFDAGELAKRVGLGATLGGDLRGDLEVGGSIAAPEGSLRLTWDRPAAGGVRADRLEVEAATEGDVLRVRAQLERGGAEAFAASGTLPLERSLPLRDWPDRMRDWLRTAESSLELQAREFPLDWLPALAPALPLQTRGTVNGRVSLAGGLPVPAAHGQLEISGGTFALATQKTRIGPVAGTLHFAGHRAYFDRLQLAARRGQAELSGELTWAESDLQEVTLRIDFDKYRFDQLDLMQTTLNGTLLARGALQAIDVTGAIELGDVRISLPSAQDPILKEIRVLGLPEAGSGTAIREGEIAGIQERSTVDVYIRLPRGTWVRGMGLDAEVVGEVRVVKEPGRPTHLVGRLEVQHGRYRLQGKSFELERGVASFGGGERAVPDVDILARQQVTEDVLVRVHVTGPADAPRLELTSEPPMDQAEIISYVFLGRSSAGQPTAAGQSAQASAASLAGTLLVDGLAPELRETLHVDAINVTSDEEGAPAVEIEAQLTPEVYLRLIQSLGASADEAVEVRWRFWKGLTLKSRVSRSGSSAIDLLWEHDYWGLERFGLGGLKPPPPPYRDEVDD